MRQNSFPPSTYDSTRPTDFSSSTHAATSFAEQGSAGKTSIFSLAAEAGWTPPSSLKHHMPTNSRRAVGEHSTTCSLLKNSGLMVRYLAIWLRSFSPCQPRPRSGLDAQQLASRSILVFATKYV